MQLTIMDILPIQLTYFFIYLNKKILYLFSYHKHHLGAQISPLWKHQ